MVNVRNNLKKMGASLATTAFDKGYEKAFDDMRERIISHKENISIGYIDSILDKLKRK